MADIVRVDSTPDLILNAFAAKLRDGVDGADEANCYVSDDPDALPTPLPGGDFCWVISPSPSGQFDSRLWEGGGIYQATVDMHIVVTVHSIAQNDEPHRAQEFFNNRSRGLFTAVMPAVLKAMLADGGDLLDASGRGLLAEPLAPADFQWQRPDRTSGSVQLSFAVKFDWALT